MGFCGSKWGKKKRAEKPKTKTPEDWMVRVAKLIVEKYVKDSSGGPLNATRADEVVADVAGIICQTMKK